MAFICVVTCTEANQEKCLLTVVLSEFVEHCCHCWFVTWNV